MEYTDVYELCPLCEEEVKLQAKAEIQRCPKCGKWIAPCAMCDLDTAVCYECELAKQTNVLNKKEKNDKIDEYNKLHRLKKIATTGGRNGYPTDWRDAIIGFISFEDAEKCAEKFDGVIKLLHKKDGWGAFERRCNVYSPMEITSDYFGDDYQIYDKLHYNDEEEFIQEEIVPILSSASSFESIEILIEDKKDIWKHLLNSTDNEIVVTYHDGYYSTELKNPMRFYHDTNEYEIGVVIYD